MRIAALLLLSVFGVAQASDELWGFLRGGRQVVLIRHSATEAGFGDPPGFRLEECATQRNLFEEGRRHARRIGDAFRMQRIPVARVLSSPWCRCVETARLAFGGADIEPALSNLFGRPQNRQKQVQALIPIVSERRSRDNLVLVTHGSTILALTGVSVGMGEIVVVTPQGSGRFAVAGRFTIP